MDFSKVKSITIPEGSVSKIAISNKIVWQKNDLSSYNVLPYLVATDSSRAWIDLGIQYQNGCKAEYKVTFKGTGSIFGVFYTTQRCRGYFDDSAVFNVGPYVNTTAYTRIGNLVKGTDYITTVQADPNEPSAFITIGDNTDKYNSIPPDWLAWDSSPYNCIYLLYIGQTQMQEFGVQE